MTIKPAPLHRMLDNGLGWEWDMGLDMSDFTSVLPIHIIKVVVFAVRIMIATECAEC